MQLVGRAAEFEHLVERLADRRLVTVIGPGGIGKTALARAVATECASRFELGTRPVDLTGTASATDVRYAIAGQLGFPSFEALIETPEDQSVLLLIDNCEHVVDAAAGAVAELLEACVAPTVLATSRSPLDLAGEALVVLGPLELPPPGATDAGAAAVELFLARASDAGTSIDGDDLELVAELCRRLDGVPLALELAAARTRSITPAEMIDRFDDHLAVLSRPRFRGAARHRSLRATIEWSYDLLAPPDQAFFEQLGVFGGPFTAVMAHAVAAAPRTELSATQARLDALIDASLIVPESHGSTMWYRMLVSLRALAVERLAARGVLAATQERHVDYAVREAAAIIEASYAAWPASLLLDLLTLYDTLAAAARWCEANDDDGDRALLLVSVMWGVIHQANTAEIEALGTKVLERWPDRSHPRWADAAMTVATARYILGRLTESEELALGALAQPNTSDLASVALHRVLGQLRFARGDVDEARRAFEAGAVLGREAGLVALAMESEVFHAALLGDVGRVDDALQQLRSVADEATAAGSDISAVWARTTAAYVQLRTSPGDAIEAIDRCLAETRAFGYPAGISANLRSLALGHLLLGEPAAAVAPALDLLGEATGRGALDDMHAALSVASALLAALADTVTEPDRSRELGAAAADLAASVRDLPVVSLLSSVGHELVALPTTPGRRLPIRDAVILSRTMLRRIAAADQRPASPSPPAASTEPELDVEPAPGEPVFAKVGELWDLRYGGRSALVRHSKGMDDLARLLESPEHELHCLDLVSAGVTETTTADVIDERARREYEERIRDLQEEVEDAEANADHGRAERATVELDLLVDQLSSSLGLGGRARKTTDSAERARSAVTQRIRGAIRRIDQALPPLGRHLQASISTGTFCSYRPEQPVRWNTGSLPAASPADQRA